MAKKKYYAVARGKVPGIYTSWPETQAQVSGFQGAIYKGFASREEAECFMENPVYAVTKKTVRKEAAEPSPLPEGCLGIFSDGGALGNPGVGAYGVVITGCAGRKEFKGGFARTTNNRMELMGALVGLKEAKKNLGNSTSVRVTTDSSYVVQGVEKGWARNWRRRGWLKADGNPALNRDLWEQLLDLLDGFSIPVRFQWVKGHAGHPENERCDALVNEVTRKGDPLPEDRGFPG
ncbi:MAG: ribonuclease H family protein [Desulfobacterales bacterium]|nr:ribonuclease H family protein [Desulfobacterales bacterium]